MKNIILLLTLILATLSSKAQLSDGTILYLPLNGDLNDASGNSNQTYTNSPNSYLPTYANGHDGIASSAAVFLGDSISINHGCTAAWGNNMSLMNDTGATINFWMKYHSIGWGGEVLLQFANETLPAVWPGRILDIIIIKSINAIHDSLVVTYYPSNSFSNTVSLSKILTVRDVWHNVSISFRAFDKIELYLDDVLVESKTINNKLNAIPTGFCIANDHFVNSCYSGMIDDIKIYNHAISGAIPTSFARRNKREIFTFNNTTKSFLLSSNSDSDYELNLFNLTGQIVYSTKLRHETETVIPQVSEGCYLYTLKKNNLVTNSGKIILAN